MTDPAPVPEAFSFSVVIIGRNEGERLILCLESVRAMRRPPGECEVVYVDSASRDGSPERAATAGAKVLTVTPARPCAAVGRNAGWRASRHPFVLFLDGDTVLDPGFVARASAEFRDPAVKVVWGNRRESRPQDSVYNRVLDLDWMAPAGRCDSCGGDALIRRSALEAVGGYDETLIAGEEPDMCRRMREKGGVVLHLDVPMTAHDLAMTRWTQYWRRAVRTGHAYAEVARRYQGTSDPLWSRECAGNRVRGAFWMAAPPAWLAAVLILRSPLLLTAGLAGAAAVAVRSAWKARWRSADPVTCLLYGIHSHLQQVPILVGQFEFWRHRLKGESKGLIEYKGNAS